MYTKSCAYITSDTFEEFPHAWHVVEYYFEELSDHQLSVKLNNLAIPKSDNVISLDEYRIKHNSNKET
ncbi:MAG: hypothetical protein GY941_29250 [Planctomycetes bacterium]|nr:hypothetical protein [Planctomycetota bacterium]